MKIKLSVLGVRGALPTANKECMEYGGNTTCIALAYGDELLCFDAGSGLASLGGCLSGVRQLHILISHMHIDHILGLYMLSAFHVPQIHLYGTAGDGGSFRQRLETALDRPYWPFGLCDAERVHIHEIQGGRFPLRGESGIWIDTLRGNHPGGSLLYQAQLNGARITHALDCEMDQATFARLAEFARESDLLIWDANFTDSDKQLGWGHSTWEEGVALGRAAKARQIMMTHYSRDYTDEFLRGQEQLAQKEFQGCVFAREGMVMEL